MEVAACGRDVEVDDQIVPLQHGLDTALHHAASREVAPGQ